jgi:hypothetical protein
MGRAFTPAGGAGTPFEGQEVLAGFLCPPFVGSTNDYGNAARGFQNASVLYIGATAAVNLTGLQGATPNRELTLVNVTAEAITLKNANAGSAVGNRFNFDADIVLNQWDAVRLLGAPPGAQGWIAVDATSAVAPPTPPAASGAFVYATVNQAIADSTPTAIAFDTVVFDTDEYFNSATPDVLTMPATGIYHVSVSALWAAAAAGTGVIGIAVNSALGTNFGYSAATNSATVQQGLSTSHTLSLNEGDTVSLNAIQTSGGNLNMTGIERITAISIMRVH